jgi:hypothetical protein
VWSEEPAHEALVSREMFRMHGNVRRGRNGAYYTCELNRRQSSLVPDDHPRAVYLREDKAGEKSSSF